MEACQFHASVVEAVGLQSGKRSAIQVEERRQPMFDVVGVGLNAVDYLVGLPRFPAPPPSSR